MLIETMPCDRACLVDVGRIVLSPCASSVCRLGPEPLVWPAGWPCFSLGNCCCPTPCALRHGAGLAADAHSTRWPQRSPSSAPYPASSPADMRLQTEMPTVALPRLVHRGSRFFFSFLVEEGGVRVASTIVPVAIRMPLASRCRFTASSLAPRIRKIQLDDEQYFHDRRVAGLLRFLFDAGNCECSRTPRYASPSGHRNNARRCRVLAGSGGMDLSC